jgi:RHS repeat-associated protein
LSATYGNGVVATASYSPSTFELASLAYTKGSSTLFGLNYYYQQNSTSCPNGRSAGNNGQIQCIADVSSGTGDSGRSLAYTYDSVGRLLTATTTGSTQYPAWETAETYDRYGNRSAQAAKIGSAPQPTYTINPANNQITSPIFTYDASGNVTAEPAPLSVGYSYDGEECQTSYSGNGNSATYTCDGNELRVKKAVTGTNAVTTVAIRSGGQVLAEYDNGAAVTAPTREYLYGNNLLATVTGSSGGSGGTIIYQHRDHLSPRLYTDVNGNDVGEQGTYPFGEPWYNNNTTSNWVFTSYERDAESGNDYALARSYANTQGRFLAPDPLEGQVGDPQSWNRYAYVENDPINLSDPSGQGFWEDLGFAIADIFAAILAPELTPELTAAESGAEVSTTVIIPQWVYWTGSYFAAVLQVCASGACYGGNDGGGHDPGSGVSASDPASTGSNPEGTASTNVGGVGPEGTDAASSGADAQGPGNATAQGPSTGQGAPSPAAGDVWHAVTATEVSAAVQGYFKASGKAPGKVVSILNGFGRNWTLSGDNLRAGISMAKQSGANVPGAADKVLTNVDSVHRTGDQVVISNKSDIRVMVVAQLQKTISFTVVSGNGGAALKNIQGIKIFEGFKNKAVNSWGP